AHSDIYNVLLQIMDYGRLTDNTGRQADFRNVILIMTSNVGSKEAATDLIGFNPQAKHADHTKAVERFFTPEFRNRLDAIIHFNPLTPELIRKVVDKFIGETEQRLKERRITLHVTSSARDWFAKHGFDPHFGARPIAKLIHREIFEKVVDEILFGKLTQGGSVRVHARNDKLIVSCKP
ncbi:MAG: ATP-dependent Clp protease ATP-binding subunit ClpA, partial [Lentisphaerae bacterium]